MPDIDSLSVQIKSSSESATKAIDGIIEKLKNLSSALNNYADSSHYVQGVTTLVGGFKDLQSAIGGIDVSKVKSLASAIDKLAKSSDTLSKLNFANTFTQLGAETQKANSEIKSFASEVAAEFKIPKEETDNLTNAITKLFTSTNNSQFDGAYRELEEIVKKYARVEGAAKEVQEAHRDMRKELSGTSIYVSKDVMGNWGDDAKRKRAFTGIGNTTTNMAKGFDVVTIAEEQFGIQADTSYEAFDRLQEALQDNSPEIAKQEALHNLEMMCDGLKEKIIGVAAVQETLSDDDFFPTPTNLSEEFDFTAFSSQSETAVSAINNVNNSVENLQENAKQEIGNPFEGIVKGLESLQGITIPKDSFAGISSLSTSFARFAKGDVNKSVENIQRITQSFVTMATQLSSLPAVSENVIRLAEALSRFSRQAGAASTESTKLNIGTTILSGAFNGLFTSSHKARKGFTSLAAVFGKLYASKLLFDCCPPSAYVSATFGLLVKNRLIESSLILGSNTVKFGFVVP